MRDSTWTTAVLETTGDPRRMGLKSGREGRLSMVGRVLGKNWEVGDVGRLSVEVRTVCIECGVARPDEGVTMREFLLFLRFEN